MSNLTRESAHSACVPGSAPAPGGGDDGSPPHKVKNASEPAGCRGAGTLSRRRESSVRGGNTCARQGRPRAGRPLPAAAPPACPPKFSSAVFFEVLGELPESGVNLGHGSGKPARLRSSSFTEASGGCVGRGTVGSQRPGCFSAPPHPSPPTLFLANPDLREPLRAPQPIPGPLGTRPTPSEAPPSGWATPPRPNPARNNELQVPPRPRPAPSDHAHGSAPGRSRPRTWCRAAEVRRAPRRPLRPARRWGGPAAGVAAAGAWASPQSSGGSKG